MFTLQVISVIRPVSCCCGSKKAVDRGFTLIEIVAGIVVIAISFAMLNNVLFPAVSHSGDAIIQIRAAEFGQALMEEILAKPYDENTPVGGVPPCDDDPVVNACSTSLGVDAGEIDRGKFDDTDDYHDYCDTSAPYHQIEDAFGDVPTGFENYSMSVCVYFDGDYNRVTAPSSAAPPSVARTAKRVEVDIYTPGASTPIRFKAYRSNF